MSTYTMIEQNGKTYVEAPFVVVRSRRDDMLCPKCKGLPARASEVGFSFSPIAIQAIGKTASGGSHLAHIEYVDIVGDKIDGITEHFDSIDEKFIGWQASYVDGTDKDGLLESTEALVLDGLTVLECGDCEAHYVTPEIKTIPDAFL